jgi:hypothetical protein
MALGMLVVASLALAGSLVSQVQPDWMLARVLDARSGHAMAYDGARQRVVLFGGVTESGFVSDTWE